MLQTYTIRALPLEMCTADLMIIKNTFLSTSITKWYYSLGNNEIAVGYSWQCVLLYANMDVCVDDGMYRAKH